MKALYITNNYSAPEMRFLERVQYELGSFVDTITLDELPEFLKRYVRATPALIIFSDDLQGEGLLAEGTDGKLVVTGMTYQRLEEEELAIHNMNSCRMDNLIHSEVFIKIGQHYNVAQDMADIILEGGWEAMAVDERKIRVWKWMVQEGKITLTDIPEEYRSQVEEYVLPVLSPESRLLEQVEATASAVDFILMNFML